MGFIDCAYLGELQETAVSAGGRHCECHIAHVHDFAFGLRQDSEGHYLTRGLESTMSRI